MALATAAAAVGVAATAYLDAKYHLRKDAAAILESRQIGRVGQKRAKQNRRSLWYAFEEQATKLKDEEALWYRLQPSEQAVTYTWTETYRNCCRFGQFLLQNGVKPGDLISTYQVNSPEFVFGLLGSWSIGSAPAMINYNLAGDALIHSLKVSGSKILLVDEDGACQKRIEDARSRIENELGMKIIILDSAVKAVIASMEPVRPGDGYRNGVTGEFPMFLFYTSGSTGMPKACALQTQRSYAFGISRKRTTGVKGDGGGWYICMPMYHGTAGTSLVGCMTGGVRCAIGRRFSVRNFWQDIHDSKAECFVYVGETARYLLAAPPSPLDRDHNLKAMYGNGMRPDVWRKFMDRFNIPCVNEFFNSTEGMLSLLNVCRGPFHDAHVGHHGALMRYALRDQLVPVEIDHENGDGIWRDPQTGFAKRNAYEQGGEILVACRSQADFTGYHNNPQATDQRFVRDVFREGDLYYRTGDALRRDEDGRWFFMDRLGDTFRWKSENVSTAEVAEVLGRFPKLVESNVYGVEVPNHDGRAGCAAVYIEPTERASFDWKALADHSRASLPKYAVPVFVRLLASQSPMHNNKQNKVPLRKEGIDLKKISEGDVGKNDTLMWLPPGGEKYIPFSERDWNSVVGGKARL